MNRVALAALAAIYLLLCSVLAYRLNIWQDEAYSLHSSGAGALNAWHQGIVFEAQAPLYFVVLALWRALDPSAFGARLLSIACSLVTLYATWQFARRYVARIAPSLIVAAIAFNPFMIWAAVEIRPYAAVIAFSSALLYSFFRGFVEDEYSLRARVAFGLLAVAGTYTQYYVALLLPASFVALVALRRWKAMPSFIALSAAVAVALVPLAFIVPEQFSAYHAFAVAFRLPSYAMLIGIFEYVLPRTWIASWRHEPIRNACYFLAALVPVVLATGHVRRLDATTRALLAIVATIVCIFTAAIWLAHIHVLIGRHTAVMFVPIVLLAFALVGAIAQPRRRAVLAVYIGIYTVFSILSLWQQYHTLSKAGDWARVASYLDQHASDRDVVAVFNAEAELPLRYYLKGDARIVAIPRSMRFDRFDESRFVLHDDRDIATAFTESDARAKNVWLVESSVCAMRTDFFRCDLLQRYVSSHFTTLGRREFDGSTVLELRQRGARSPVATAPSIR